MNSGQYECAYCHNNVLLKIVKMLSFMLFKYFSEQITRLRSESELGMVPSFTEL